MKEHTAEIDRTHNIVLVIITISCIAAIIESIAQGWEFWVPPLILIGLVAAWFFHISHYGKIRFRENFCIVMCMAVSFFHGVHKTSFFDIVVISMLLMVTITLLGRKELLIITLIEFFIIMIIQFVWAVRLEEFAFDALNISRLLLHVLAEICVFRALREIIKKLTNDEAFIKAVDDERNQDKEKIEKFLGNIYQDLMVPVNQICELSAEVLRRGFDEKVGAIMGNGMRLAWQIRDIHDYSEIQRDNVILHEDDYKITDLFGEYVTDYRSGPLNISIDMIIDLDPELPKVMKGDVYKLGKIIRLIVHNSIKFTKEGCIYVKVSGVRRDNVFNLMMEFSDTGSGMSQSYVRKLSEGSYLSDRVHNAELGGIGLGIPIVYGFVRKMNGFVSIESKINQGTTVKICVPQQIIDDSPCLAVKEGKYVNTAFYSMPGKYKGSQVREYYRAMAGNLAQGLRINMYAVPTLAELKKLMDKRDITHVFFGEEEYIDASKYFDELAAEGKTVVVSANKGFIVNEGSQVLVMPKPLYSHAVVEYLSGDFDGGNGYRGQGEGGRA
ncbi:MAG: HAMP domain-containing histidine kinase [Butyrivibrio sp.]|nr:HAMP domain-containing histidine kinase [Butyrivibrio sp.]